METKQFLLGDDFPNIEMNTTQGKFKIYDFQKDSWLIFFSHPKDFTPVCTTELGRVAKLKQEWAKRNTKVLAMSIDTVESHNKWQKDIEETQTCKVDYPIVEDDGTLAKQLGMLHPNCDAKVTVRSVYIVGPDKKIKLILQYPPSCGRNFDEILRCLDSLQLTAYEKVATPENWKEGDKCVIIPSLNDEQAKALFPQGWTTVKPYLRLVDVKKKQK